MYKIDFNEPIHIHFIGIGGISMSAAEMPFKRRLAIRLRHKGISFNEETGF